MKNRMLYVAYYYEDEISPLGIQSKRLINALKEIFDLTVVYRSKNSSILDKSSCLNDGIRLLPVFSKDLSKWDKRFSRYVISINDFFSFDLLVWSMVAFKGVKTQNYDHILIASNPFTVQVIGILLRYRNKKIKYVSQFFDPLVENFFSKLSKTAQYLRSKFEHLIVKNSDFVIVNNELQMNKCIQRYSSKLGNKFFLVPFCTDSKILDIVSDHINYDNTEGNSINRKLLITHTGSIYGYRNLNLLINALKFLNEKIENLEDVLEVRLIGHCIEDEYNNVKKANLMNIVSFIPPMSQLLAYRYLVESDALLLIDPDVEESVFFPSKLCEYFAFNKIILGLVPEKSPSKFELEKAGHLVFNKKNHIDLANTISLLLSNKFFYQEYINKDYWKFFLPSRVAVLVSNILANEYCDDTQKNK